MLIFENVFEAISKAAIIIFYVPKKKKKEKQQQHSITGLEQKFYVYDVIFYGSKI